MRVGSADGPLTIGLRVAIGVNCRPASPVAVPHRAHPHNFLSLPTADGLTEHALSPGAYCRPRQSHFCGAIAFVLCICSTPHPGKGCTKREKSNVVSTQRFHRRVLTGVPFTGCPTTNAHTQSRTILWMYSIYFTTS